MAKGRGIKTAAYGDEVFIETTGGDYWRAMFVKQKPMPAAVLLRAATNLKTGEGCLHLSIVFTDIEYWAKLLEQPNPAPALNPIG